METAFLAVIIGPVLVHSFHGVVLLCTAVLMAFESAVIRGYIYSTPKYFGTKLIPSADCTFLAVIYKLAPVYSFDFVVAYCYSNGIESSGLQGWLLT